ncbi:MAG: hypothetical protein VYA89_08310, partial [Actinomycetota bacterium]|nr:hypothetical protein [Actinomycetota bacterium]
MSLGLAIALTAVLMAASGGLVAVGTALLNIRRARATVLLEEQLAGKAQASGVRKKSLEVGTGDGRRAERMVALLDDRVRSLTVVHLLVLGCRLAAAGTLAAVMAERSGVRWAVVALVV